MITVSNQGFWAFGRQKEPVAVFREGPAPKLTPSYPPRLVEGSKTPIGRAGTRSTEEILNEPPANELGKRVARGSPLQKPKREYNKGQLGRLTGPGFKIPAPVPWSFDAANKALEGIDAKDRVVEDMMRAPLSPAGYMDLITRLLKAERDETTRDVLKAWRAELTKIAATVDLYERQGRTPDAAITKRRDQLHDEIDRWVVTKKVPSVVAVGAVSADESVDSSTPIPRRRRGRPASSAGIPPTIVSPTVSKAVGQASPSASPVPRLKLAVRQSERLAEAAEEKSSLPSNFPSSEEILDTGRKGKGKGVRAALQWWKTTAGVETSFQGKAGQTNEVLAKKLVADITAAHPGWR